MNCFGLFWFRFGHSTVVLRDHSQGKVLRRPYSGLWNHKRVSPMQGKSLKPCTSFPSHYISPLCNDEVIAQKHSVYQDSIKAWESHSNNIFYNKFTCRGNRTQGGERRTQKNKEKSANTHREDSKTPTREASEMYCALYVTDPIQTRAPYTVLLAMPGISPEYKVRNRPQALLFVAS